jgi:CRP/FNR family transcriptional regulator, cyclic AMP receptor protein
VDVFQEAEMLRRVPFFGGLDAAKLKLLAFTSRALKFAPGEDLMKKGEPADSAYVILDGEAEVIGETSKGEFVVAMLRSNELTGEMGVIRNRPRGATVRAKTPVRALRISSEVFLGLITENPECALDVMRQLSARVDASNARLAAAQRELETLRKQAGSAAPPSGPDAKT